MLDIACHGERFALLCARALCSAGMRQGGPEVVWVLASLFPCFRRVWVVSESATRQMTRDASNAGLFPPLCCAAPLSEARARSARSLTHRA